MATEYIDKFSFAKYLESRYCMKCMAKDRTVNAPFLCHSCTINDMFHDLETYPTEDVVERKRGKLKAASEDLIICTSCKCGFLLPYPNRIEEAKTVYGWKFCPNCGAKMESADDV